MEWSKLALIGVALAVAMVASSRILGSFWTVIYKVAIGGVCGAVCLVAMQRIDTTPDLKWLCSIAVGVFVTFAASGIPWR